MALIDTTKKIQEAVGATADGVYGKNTALKIIGKLGFTKEDLTKIIQKKTDSLPDGAYGPNTAETISDALGLSDAPAAVEVTSSAVDGVYPEISKPSPNISSSRIKPEGVVSQPPTRFFNLPCKVFSLFLRLSDVICIVLSVGMLTYR